MARSPAERHLIRFQKWGRAEDLAAVFDATAAELLRVASHLTRDLHEAEDLVQNTFLAAIEHRAQYQRRSDVLAWLQGILVNAARNLRRTKARRPEPDRLRADVSHDPAETAAALEISQTISDAIAGLPEPYRPVLNFHLRNGLSAQEIALSLDRPPATVRSQMARGLELLRRALPSGIASGVAVVATPTRGLAAIRDVVIQSASQTVPAATTLTATLVGALMMSTQSKVLSSAAVLALTGLMIWSVTSPNEVLPLPSEGNGEPVLRAIDLPDQEAGSHAPDFARDSETHRTAIGAVGDFVLRGEVKRKGLPFSDLKLTLNWYDGFDTDGDPTMEQIVPVDGNGEFTWVGPRVDIARTALVTSSDPQHMLSAPPLIVLPDEEEAFYAIRVHVLDCLLEGRVQDGGGNPIGGAYIALNFAWRETTSDSDGRFQLQVGSGIESRPLVVSAPGFAMKIEQLTIPDDSTVWNTDITLRPGRILAGQVIDTQGVPIPDVAVDGDRRSSYTPAVRTDSDGRFAVFSVLPTGNQWVSASKKGFAYTTKRCRIGAEDIEIVLEPGTSVVGQVVQTDGSPIWGAKVYASILEGSMSDDVIAQTHTNQDGEFTLEDIAAGGLSLTVMRPDFITHKSMIVVGDGKELTIRLKRGGNIHGRITFQGQPLAAAAAFCQTGRGVETRGLGNTAISAPDGRFRIGDLPSTPFDLVVYKKGYERVTLENVTTKSPAFDIQLEKAPSIAGKVLDGQTREPIEAFTVTISGSLQTFPLNIREADGSWSSDMSQRALEAEAGTEVQVEIQAEGYATGKLKVVATVDPDPESNVLLLYPGVTVQGSVHSNDVPVVGATLQIIEVDQERPSMEGPEFTTDERGFFSIPSLSSGPTRLVALHSDHVATVHGPIEIGTGPGTLEVVIEMDAGTFLRGRVDGFDEIENLTVTASNLQTRQRAKAEVSADGSFSFEGLGLGTYRLSMPRQIMRSFQVELTAAGLKGVVLAEREGPCAIRGIVLGEVKGNAQLSLIGRRPQGISPGRRIVMLENGRFAFEGVAPGKYLVEVFDAASRIVKTEEVELTGEDTVDLVIDFDK